MLWLFLLGLMDEVSARAVNEGRIRGKTRCVSDVDEEGGHLS